MKKNGKMARMSEKKEKHEDVKEDKAMMKKMVKKKCMK